MSQRTKDALRLVLVDGMRVVDAAKQMEMSKQQVQNAVARFETAIKAAQGIPEDWECTTVFVPPELATEIKELERKAKRAAGLIID